MSEVQGRRRPRVLSPETKWEIFLQVTSGETTQADAARKWQVGRVDDRRDPPHRQGRRVGGVRRKPGRPTRERVRQLDAARSGIEQLTEAIKAQAIELAVVRGNPAGLSGPVPARVGAEVKELVLKTVDDAVAAGFAHAWACALWQISDDRVHRWRQRRRDHPVHGLLGWEIDAVLEIAERWGPVDRSHRKLAHRGSYEGLVWVAPLDAAARSGCSRPRPTGAACPATGRQEAVAGVAGVGPEPDLGVGGDTLRPGSPLCVRDRRSRLAQVDRHARVGRGDEHQVKVLFEHALTVEGLIELVTPDRLDLADDDPTRPILLAVSDNGPQ